MLLPRDDRRDSTTHPSLSGDRLLCRLLWWLLFAGVGVGTSSCDSPGNFFRSAPAKIGSSTAADEDQSTPDPSKKNSASNQGSPAPASSAPDSGGDKSSGDNARHGQSTDDLAVEVHSLKPSADKARRILAHNFSGFWDRRGFGFDRHLFSTVFGDLRYLGKRAANAPAALSASSGRQVFQTLLPAIVICLLMVVFAIVDRACLRGATRWQAHVHLDFSRKATQIGRALIMLAGRTLPGLILVGLSYFPVRALITEAAWSRFLSQALWLALTLRAISSAVTLTLSGRLIDAPPEAADRLETYSIWVARIIFGFLLVLTAIDVFEYRRSVYNLVLFCLRFTVAIVPTYLFFARSSVLALLPDYDGSPLFGAFQRAISDYYYWILSVTVVLLMVRATGYATAANFVLVRGYGIILVLIAAFVADHAVSEFLIRRTEAIDAHREFGERPDESSSTQLAESLEKFIVVGGTMMLVVVISKLLLVYDAAVALLRSPLVVVGEVQISVFNLLTVGLVIFGTILVIQISKAVLNAKIYPAFSVDVGVAYALNTLLSYVLVIVGFLSVLASIGINLSAIAVVLASLGVGIGFGLQSLVENLISGFIILFGRSVKKGDFVTVDDTYGQVEAVGARSVVIRTPDNYEMLIPSKEIVNGQITNWSFHNSTVRGHVEVGAGYNSEPAEVKRVLIEAANNFEFVLERPEPEVWLTGFADSSVGYELLVYFDCNSVSPNRLKGLIYFDIWQSLHEAGIELPFPQRDLHVRTAEAMPEVAKALADWKSTSAEQSLAGPSGGDEPADDADAEHSGGPDDTDSARPTNPEGPDA